jgi:CHASE2 domain-containing sensor protein
MLEVLAISVMCGSITFLILRRAGGAGRTAIACGTGAIVAFAISVVLFVIPQIAWDTPPTVAGRVLGEGLFSAILGPAIGVWAAKRARLNRSHDATA